MPFPYFYHHLQERELMLIVEGFPGGSDSKESAWTEELGGLQSMGSQRFGHMTEHVVSYIHSGIFKLLSLEPTVEF